MTLAPRARPRSAPVIGIVVGSPQWKAVTSLSATLRRAVEATWPPERVHGEIAILLTDDDTIRALNKEWRGRDEATNVLSFPSRSVRGDAAPIFLGDIAIAYGVAAREAAAEGKVFLHHVTHLAVHGVLHLLGYDHESADEAEIMEGLERKILAELGIPDPYATHEAKI
jgi:probable rRNA maturation factor